ncbi:MAG: energy transducer TonB [Gammaproteobacteria bacterium]
MPSAVLKTPFRSSSEGRQPHFVFIGLSITLLLHALAAAYIWYQWRQPPLIVPPKPLEVSLMVPSPAAALPPVEKPSETLPPETPPPPPEEPSQEQDPPPLVVEDPLPPPEPVAVPLPRLPPPKQDAKQAKVKPKAVEPVAQTATAVAEEAVPEKAPEPVMTTPPAPVTARVEEPVDLAAAYRNNPSPDYPRSAKRLRIEGTVMLRVLVSPEGKALQVDIATSSGADMLDEAARSSVSDWTFSPATSDGQAIKSTVIVPIKFNLK